MGLNSFLEYGLGDLPQLFRSWGFVILRKTTL